MAEEYFDLVDENDNVIGIANRMDAHYEGLRHRVVIILVFNKKRELLLQKRSLSKDTSPGRWSLSASGHVDKGESYDGAAKRELREELGIEAEIKRLGKMYQNTTLEHRMRNREFMSVYYCIHEGPFNFKKKEISGLKFFTFDDIVLMAAENPEMVAKTVSNVLKLFYNRGNIRGEARIIEKSNKSEV